MFFQVLRIAREASIILLAFEALILSLIPLFILYKITQGLRKLKPKVRPALRQAQSVIFRFGQITERVMSLVAAPVIWAESMETRSRTVAGAGRHAARGLIQEILHRER